MPLLPDTASPVHRSVWLTIGLAAFASMLALRACDPLLPQLANEFGAGLAAAAWTVSAYALGYGLTQLVFGPLGDRFGKPRVMAAATGLAAAFNLAVAAAPSLPTMVAARALAGAAAGGIIPLAMAHIGDAVPYERRQVALSRLLLATLTGMVCGQWLGGAVGGAFGWRWMFVGLGGVFVACAWGLARMPAARRAAGRRSRVADDLRDLWRRPWPRCVIATVALEGAFAFSLLSFVPARMQQLHGFTPAEAGACVALFGAGGFGFALGSRALLRRLSEAALPRLGAVLVGLSAAALAFASDWRWILATNVIGGFGLYMLHNTLQTHATQMAPERRGTAVALFAACLFVGQSAGVWIAAHAFDAGHGSAVFAFTAVATPLLGHVFALLARRLRPLPG